MKISSKTYYGLRALAALKNRYTQRSIADIARNERIPVKYLEKIFQKLKKDGLVNSSKGVSGGYSLAIEADKITMADIFLSLEGPIITAPCSLSEYECSKSGNCASQLFWISVEKTLRHQFEKITLQQIMKNAADETRIQQFTA